MKNIIPLDMALFYGAIIPITIEFLAYFCYNVLITFRN
jgi:hypothetical protein